MNPDFEKKAQKTVEVRISLHSMALSLYTVLTLMSSH